MRRTAFLLATLLLTGLTAFGAHAADDKPAQLPPIKPGWTLLPDEVPDARIERLVNEDDHVRVEELRERGVTKKVVVHLKKSALPDYEILVGDAKYEPGRGQRGDAAGMRGTRVWSILDY